MMLWRKKINVQLSRGVGKADLGLMANMSN